jgi:hypothetical protein
MFNANKMAMACGQAALALGLASAMTVPLAALRMRLASAI